ncbi:hypothetical protein PDN41_15250 [Bacillus cereus]|nr:hypothetical protein [Bacillus cereus]
MEIKDLIGILVEQNKSFKDMLQFAIGGILTILVIFLTANYFTMRKFREDEIEKIEMQVLKNVKENSLPNLTQELNDNLESLVAAKLGSLEARCKSLESKLERKSVNLESNLEDQKEQLKELEGDIMSLRGDTAFNDGVYSNAFTFYLNAGHAYLDATSKGSIGKILRSLEKTADKLTYVLSDVSNFAKFASRLDDEHQPQVTKIANILKDKKTL